MFRWEKRQLIYAPNRRYEWNQSHAQVPVVDTLGGDAWRIYYSTRSADNRSTTSFIEVEAGRPERILSEADRPILELGKLGTFDESGIMPSCILTVGTRKYLYYIGWSLKKTVPYQNTIGLAISDDGGRTFQRYSDGPLLGVNTVDPYFTGTIFVLPDDGVFRAYYLSCVEWKVVNGKPEPTYVLKYAESPDGLSWSRTGHVAVPFKDDEEGGLVSAAVVKLSGRYHMWFAHRKYDGYRDDPRASYRIGYASSSDGVNWERRDGEAGIEPSATGWDSQMIAYPYVLRHEQQLYMFYNGNEFGRSGFGYAVARLP